jgi:hypothetical protein
MKRSILAVLTCTAAATAPAPVVASADDGPLVRPDSKLVSAGESYSLVGEGWYVGSHCEPRVHITRTLRHGVRIGSAPIRANGTFVFTRRIARSTKPGMRLRLEATQYCDGIGETRSTTVRVGRPEHGCPGFITVDEKAYVLRVTAGMSCSRGAGAVGPFIDTDIEPNAYLCSWADPAIAGYDAACQKVSNPASRVTARRISDV